MSSACGKSLLWRSFRRCLRQPSKTSSRNSAGEALSFLVCSRVSSLCSASAASSFDPREPAAEEDIHRRIREENNHVQRYMSLLLEPRTYRDTLWQILYRVPNPQMSYLPVRVPDLWGRCASSGPRHMGRHRTA